MFIDRQDAGKKLALALEKYKDHNVLVLAIPRGGAEVGYYVAEYLRADFSLVVSRKLPFPDNLESGFGAVAEDGGLYLIKEAAAALPRADVVRIIDEQADVIKERVRVLRRNSPLPGIADRTVILVDDGIAMGSTMHAAVNLALNRKVKKIVVAAPVAAIDRIREFRRIADEVVVLNTPANFRAVADSYLYWRDVTDQKVLEILDSAAAMAGRPSPP